MTTVPARRRPARATAGARVPAADLPVARVLVDVSLAHLDRPYDYLVAEPDSPAARPGARVRVRFAGRLVGGYIVARMPASDHEGKLGFIERVVSAEPVLSAEVAELARAVADRYAGSVADVLRLAVPPRHAKTEAEAAVATTGVVAPGGVGGHSATGETTAPIGVGGHGAMGETTAPIGETAQTGWSRYPAGPAFLKAVRTGRPARAVWQALPGEDWPVRLAEVAATAADQGAGALLIVPDARDLTRLDAALSGVLGADRHVSLSADLGPAERYRRFLAVSRGRIRVVAGTRAAVFAPVADLGVVAVFDDGDDLLAEPRAPYPHAREVLMLRSAARSCALLVGGFARTAEAQLLVESNWARPIVAARARVRACAPRVEAAGDDFATGADSAAARARLTPAGFAAARASLQAGAPVLIQVPRRGYLPSLACTRCRRPAQCRHCRGPLALAAPAAVNTTVNRLTTRSPSLVGSVSNGAGAGRVDGRPGRGLPPTASDLLSCRWCGIPEAHFRCSACGSDQLRAVAIGAGRTAEEIGRAFPGFPVVTSSGQKVRAGVPSAPALVVATPGAEPVADGGYGAALLLDGAAMLARPDLRAAEETLRRWMAAAAMVRSIGDGGRVVVGADASLPLVQALIRWDPVGHATAELAARRDLGFPPAVAMASIEGTEEAVLPALDRLDIPLDGELLGPVALDDIGGGGPTRRRSTEGGDDGELVVRALVRAPQSQRKVLGAALRALAAGRSARKEGGGLRIRVDPPDLF